MAVTTENFRTSLHGFNRMDVVQFIQKMTIEHERELRHCNEKTASIQAELDALRLETSALQREKAELEAALAALSEEMPMEAVQSETLDAPMMDPQAATASFKFDEMELSAYRRAEMTERMARERAAVSAERMKLAFTQANEKLSLTEQDIVTLMSAFRTNFEQLQQVLDTVQGVFAESTESLRAAGAVCCEP